MTNYLFFWSEKGRQGVYSQWYPSEFVENDLRFVNAEQYMMYRKAKMFGDIMTARKILESRDPREIKDLGRQVQNFDESKWVMNRETIVIQGNYLKFSQDAELKKKILSDNYEFVEASPYDRVWGIGFAQRDALANRQSWGSNLLGKCLNRVRDMLVEEHQQEERIIENNV